VHIIPEAKPSHIPRDAFGILASVPNYESGKVLKAHQKACETQNASYESDIGDLEEESFDNEDMDNESSSEEDDVDSERRVKELENQRGSQGSSINLNLPTRHIGHTGWGGACKAWASDESKFLFRIQRTALPHWVYRMYDAYALARRAAGENCCSRK
jgi:cereblon